MSHTDKYYSFTNCMAVYLCQRAEQQDAIFWNIWYKQVATATKDVKFVQIQ